MNEGTTLSKDEGQAMITTDLDALEALDIHTVLIDPRDGIVYRKSGNFAARDIEAGRAPRSHNEWHYMTLDGASGSMSADVYRTLLDAFVAGWLTVVWSAA